MRITSFKEKRFRSSPTVEMHNRDIMQAPWEVLVGHTVLLVQ